MQKYVFTKIIHCSMGNRIVEKIEIAEQKQKETRLYLACCNHLQTKINNQGSNKSANFYHSRSTEAC